MKRKSLLLLCVITMFFACQKIDVDFDPKKNAEDITSLNEISSTDIGGEAAAEISAFDPKTNKLFVITNAGTATEIEVLDITNPAATREYWRHQHCSLWWKCEQRGCE